jgi:hypothetical protein
VVSKDVPVDNRNRKSKTYPQVLLGRKNLSEKLAGTDTQRVTQQPHLLDIVGAKFGNVRLDVLGGIELETFPFEGKNLGRSHICS